MCCGPAGPEWESVTEIDIQRAAWNDSIFSSHSTLEVDGTVIEEWLVYSGDELPRSCCKLNPIVAIQNK